MKAKVTTEFNGRPDGDALARAIKVGETITGNLAAVAVRERWAEEIGDPSPSANIEKRLDRMKKDELQALAAQLGVTLKGDETNKQIIALLNQAEEEPK